MRVKFKEMSLEIKNESSKRSEFNAKWNGYSIEVTPFETHYNSNGKQKLKYEATCINPLGDWICDCTVCDTISSGVQECFKNISIDIDDLKSQYDEIGQWLEKVRDYL